MTAVHTIPRAAYIHVPFCIHRCGYCDFTVVAGRDDLVEPYLDALECEMQTLSTPSPVETLFIGGGTPTQLPPQALQRLLQIIRRWLPLNADGEWSIEANPVNLTDEKIDVLAAAGVNRVSLGAQAFDPRVLQTLERDHTPEQIRATVRRLQPSIPNIALDLIFGVPGQTLAVWKSSLQAAIDIGATHVSTYGLTIEKGTQFWNRREHGTLHPLEDEVERSMYAAAMDTLDEAGFQQYEISNFARPGFHCRHNETYWNADPYLAFGPGAARYINGRRETNHRSTTTWIKRIQSGTSPVGDAECLTPIERARERIVLGLRRTAGIDTATFQATTGFEIEEIAPEPLRRNLDAGLLERDGNHIRLTRDGRFLADSVVVDFL